MGDIPDHLFEEFRTMSRDRVREQLVSGEYVGWLASPVDSLGQIIAGAGVQLRRVSPHPSTGPNGERGIAEGRHAIILNVVFTRSRRWTSARYRRIINATHP